jgi:hypothetical protein
MGPAAANGTWDRSFTPSRRWILHTQQVIGAGNEAVAVMRNLEDLGGRRVGVNGVEIFSADDSGRIVQIRAFFDQPTEFVLTDWFTVNRSG